MTYKDAMDRYGSDKPDLRFANELVDVTQFFKDTTFRVFQAEYVGAVVMPGGASSPRRELDEWQEWAKARGAKGLAYILVQADGSLAGPVAKNLSETESKNIASKVGAKNGDAIFFAAGGKSTSQNLLGAARLEIGNRCNLIPENKWEYIFNQIDKDGKPNRVQLLKILLAYGQQIEILENKLANLENSKEANKEPNESTEA